VSDGVSVFSPLSAENRLFHVVTSSSSPTKRLPSLRHDQVIHNARSELTGNQRSLPYVDKNENRRKSTKAQQCSREIQRRCGDGSPAGTIRLRHRSIMFSQATHINASTVFFVITMAWPFGILATRWSGQSSCSTSSSVSTGMGDHLQANKSAQYQSRRSTKSLFSLRGKDK